MDAVRRRRLIIGMAERRQWPISAIAVLSRMLGAASDQALAEIRAVIERYGDADAPQDLESLIALGKLERSSEAPT